MTPERLAQLRGPMGGGRMLTASECLELCDAYDRLWEAFSMLCDCQADECGLCTPCAVRIARALP